MAMPFHNRRTLVGAAIGGVLLLGAVGVGIIYFLVFPNSSPSRLTLASTASPTASASANGSPAAASAGSWSVAPGSQAGYRVRETLAFVGAPSDAVGRTSSVHGSVTIAGSGSGYAVSTASLTVDVNTLSSHQPEPVGA